MVSAITFTTIAGLSLAVTGGQAYEFAARLIINKGAAITPIRVGMSFPAMQHTRGTIFAAASVVQGAALSASYALWDGDSASGSAVASVASATGVSGWAQYDGIFLTSSTGTGTVHLGAIGMTGTSALSFFPGSYMKLVRIP